MLKTSDTPVRLTGEAIQQIREKADEALRNWPAVKAALSSHAILSHVHGARYVGPTIDLDALLNALPTLCEMAAQSLWHPDMAQAPKEGRQMLPEGITADNVADVLQIAVNVLVRYGHNESAYVASAMMESFRPSGLPLPASSGPREPKADKE